MVTILIPCLLNENQKVKHEFDDCIFYSTCFCCWAVVGMVTHISVSQKDEYKILGDILSLILHRIFEVVNQNNSKSIIDM